MFVYGFAVSVDWETHQFYIENRDRFELSNGGPRLRVAIREPVDYKGQEPSNLVFLGVSSFFSVQQNFFIFKNDIGYAMAYPMSFLLAGGFR